MKLVGSKDKKKKAEDVSAAESVKAKGRVLLAYISRYQVIIIALAVAAILSFASLQMLHLIDPPVDEDYANQIAQQTKTIRINSKDIDQIKSLTDSQTTSSPNLDPNRQNPFSE